MVYYNSDNCLFLYNLKSIFIICVVLIYLWIMCIFLNYRFLKLHANNHCYANICLVYKIICFSCLFFTDSHYWWSVNFKTNDYKIGICCFSAKHEALRRKSKDWLPRNQNNVSEWSGATCIPADCCFSELAL
jgi:hypothetical protein